MAAAENPLLDERVLILAPTARDGETTARLLEKSGIACALCESVEAVARGIAAGAGAAVLTQEAVLGPGAESLKKALAEQPAWSELPLIMLTPQSGDSERSLRELRTVGHMTLIRRPVQISGFISAVQSALRDRARQYKIRDHFAERDRQAAELREAVKKANAANVAKGEFLATMSHEIRTPMSVVLGLSDILATSSPLTDKQASYIQTLKRSADALLHLINDLLDISKIEASSIELENVGFSFEPLVTELARMMALQTEGKGLSFVTDYASVRNKRFWGDPSRIRQILTNLCGNAIKFTPMGTITLKVTARPSAEKDVWDVRLDVSDTGVGIPEDKRAMIFDKFTQADSSINRKYGGTGLGLAITRELAELMQGSIEVSSEMGRGSTFSVHLPLKIQSRGDAEAQTNGAPAEERPGSASAYKGYVLLVEDHEPNVMVAATYLDSFGFLCDVAKSGAKALERVKLKSYLAVLMDVQMPGMSGLETTQAIREFEKENARRPIPIIGMTANALSGDREKCLASGMDDYISKPFNPGDLENKLRQFVP